MGGTWNAFPYGYSDYSMPGSDWLTSLTTDLENGPLGFDNEVQQKEYQSSILGNGIHRISQLDSPVEVAEADSTQHRYPIVMPYHHPQPMSHGVQANQQLQSASKGSHPNGPRYMQHGYFTNHGRMPPTAAGPKMVPTSLYPSPPGQVPSAEDNTYNKTRGLMYMNGDHVPSTIAYPGHPNPALGTAQYGTRFPNDAYQPCPVPPITYDRSGTIYPGMMPTTMESSILPTPKYDGWNMESPINHPMISPLAHPPPIHGHGLAIKQEYIPSHYISPSPSSIAGGSSIKAELFSDTSRTPPLVVSCTEQTKEPTRTSVEASASSHHIDSMGIVCRLDGKTNDAISKTPSRKPQRYGARYGSQFMCTECRRTFARQCGLTQHMKWHHSGEKPCRCYTCGKCFSTQIALDEHLVRHTAIDKPFRCQQCPKAFFHKNDLRRHNFVHTGMAPHLCRYCSKTFARKDHCNSHEFSHERKMLRKERKGVKSRDSLVGRALDAVGLAEPTDQPNAEQTSVTC